MIDEGRKKAQVYACMGRIWTGLVAIIDLSGSYEDMKRDSEAENVGSRWFFSV
jgi:hypothetical protein